MAGIATAMIIFLYSTDRVVGAIKLKNLWVSTIYCNIIYTKGFNEKIIVHYMVDCYNKLPPILVAIVLSSVAAMFTLVTYNPIQTIAQEEDGEPSIPQAMCNYKGYEYSLTPHIYNDGEKSSRIAFPHLPDDYAPEMTIVQGEKLTMEFDGIKQPAEIQALLVDYDADITETYPLKKIDDNKLR